MNLSFRNTLVGGLAATHLLFVAAGASHVQFPSMGPLNKAVAYYFGFSGANYCWGFFAPNMGSQFKTEFVIHRADGTSVREQLGAHGPNEVLLREAGIASTFWFAMKDKKVRRSLTASWAADVFTRHPEARSVDVGVSAFYLPSQKQIREGVPSKWVPVYSASFERAEDVRLSQGIAPRGREMSEL